MIVQEQVAERRAVGTGEMAAHYFDRHHRARRCPELQFERVAALATRRLLARVDGRRRHRELPQTLADQITAGPTEQPPRPLAGQDDPCFVIDHQLRQQTLLKTAQ